MKTWLCVCIVVVAMALSCSGVTVVLRDGKKVSGEVISQDDTKIVIKTDDGEQSVEWRRMTIACFRQLNPDLYSELVRKREERIRKAEEAKRAEGLVKAGDKWVPAKEAEKLKYKWVRMKVTANETKPSFKTYSKSNYSDSRSMQRECYLSVAVELEGLTKTNVYSLQVKCKNYLKYRDDDGSWSSSTSNKKTQELDESATIKDAVEFNAEYKTEEYLQYKYTSRGYRQRYTDEWGYESDCFEIEIYLDGKLVYRRQKDKSPEYFIVTRM